MPPRSATEQLPDAILDELNQRLVASGFAGYVALSDWLAEQGYQISKSAIHRHGSALQASMEKSINRARERMEIAKALGGMTDKEKAALLEASEMVAIDQMMDVLESLSGWEVSDKAAIIPKLARAIADIGRSATGTARWRKDFEAEAALKAKTLAAAEATQAAKAEGVSEAGLARIRAALGMVA